MKVKIYDDWVETRSFPVTFFIHCCKRKAQNWSQRAMTGPMLRCTFWLLWLAVWSSRWLQVPRLKGEKSAKVEKIENLEVSDWILRKILRFTLEWARNHDDQGRLWREEAIGSILAPSLHGYRNFHQYSAVNTNESLAVLLFPFSRGPTFFGCSLSHKFESVSDDVLRPWRNRSQFPLYRKRAEIAPGETGEPCHPVFSKPLSTCNGSQWLWLLSMITTFLPVVLLQAGLMIFCLWLRHNFSHCRCFAFCRVHISSVATTVSWLKWCTNSQLHSQAHHKIRGT